MSETLAPSQHLCREDNWSSVLDDPAPRSVRWATRTLSSRFNDPDWGKWHYTEGNGSFTACGEVVRLFMVDGSPQEGGLREITCKRCKSIVDKEVSRLRSADGVMVLTEKSL